MYSKYDPIDLPIDTCDYKEWFKKEHEEPADIPPMSPLQSDDKEVKEEAGIKILTRNKLLTRFPVLLVKIAPGNN